MNKIRINITLDPKIKTDSSKVLDELGLDLSSAISLFLKQVIIHKGLPFDLSTSDKNIYTKYAQLKDLIEQYFGFKGAKYTPVLKTISKNDIKLANKEIDKIRNGKSKLKVYKNFLEGLKDIGIEI